MQLSIGNDHAGVEYKEAIVAYLKDKGHNIINHGTDTNESVDYPDHVHPVAEQVSKNTTDLGIIICGSGNGANRSISIFSFFFIYKTTNEAESRCN